jgi:hypothetical protein
VHTTVCTNSKLQQYTAAVLRHSVLAAVLDEHAAMTDSMWLAALLQLLQQLHSSGCNSY